MKNKLLFLGALAALIAGCEKINEDPVFDTKPLIDLVAISADTLVEFQENLVLTISYKDGDGDLGTSDPDVNSIFVQDNRLEKPDEYYLPPLAPEEAKISIQGQLDLKLSPTFLLGNGSQETVEYTLYLFDRAGNQSNVLKTGPILVVRE